MDKSQQVVFEELNCLLQKYEGKKNWRGEPSEEDRNIAIEIKRLAKILDKGIPSPRWIAVKVSFVWVAVILYGVLIHPKVVSYYHRDPTIAHVSGDQIHYMDQIMWIPKGWELKYNTPQPLEKGDAYIAYDRLRQHWQHNPYSINRFEDVDCEGDAPQLGKKRFILQEIR